MRNPIFFDASGKRRKWARRSGLALILVGLAAVAVFAATLVYMPVGPDLPLRFGSARQVPLQTHGKPAAAIHSPRDWLPGKPATATRAPLTVGFYVPGEDNSAPALLRHADSLDWVVPAAISVTGPDHSVKFYSDSRFDRILQTARHRPKVLPMVQNIAGEGAWDSENTARLLHNPAARHALVKQLADLVARRRDAGLVFDFESIPAARLRDYQRLLAEMNAALPRAKVLAVTVPVGDPAWRPGEFARVADRVILMDYDEHWQGGTAGPIASQPWFVSDLAAAVREVPAARLIVAIGSYGYDWHGGKVDALTMSEAWLAAHDSDAQIVFDQASGNSAFAYEENGERHEVWMLDAATSWNQLQAIRAAGIGSVALWRLGSEDEGVWSALSAYRTGKRPNLAALSPGADVDVEGSGEILRIRAAPTIGARDLTFDNAGMIRDERYTRLPTPYVVARTGASKHDIALTFDDGPDGEWTPKILDILRQKHVPATFFVIGENALEHPGLLRRMIDDGHEIGNHTYTHPNLALDGPNASELELNATQRLVEAYTGHAMRLFRAPYFGDAEPTTADEIDPAMTAQKLGYTIVGLHVDPDDWQRPGTDAIVSKTLAEVGAASPERSANVVLLHDGGGDRSQTVAALPQIIDGLRARGYRFVPVSFLAGVPRSQVMPVVSGSDLLAVRADVGIFLVLAALGWLLKWLFFIAITLGIARALVLTALAIRQKRRERGEAPVYAPSVTVIIPAFNEAKVIEASVRRVLASDYAAIEMIVVDDGSKDETSAIVRSAFGDDPRVTLLTLENGGKARALNTALAQAKGEIIIALDADTQFEPETIMRLARWFADPGLGAVAGNAQVGNRVNLVTRWQAVEYVTAQNLERRALAAFGAITVVPGAVGAWRRTALDAVGGYPEDTLAEDQDLTIAIQRAGWRVTYDPDAVAWTEAPESFKALAKQRYRWAFGTLQCLWKHRAIHKDAPAKGLALVGLPQAWLFQIAFAAISPLIDAALVAAIVSTAIKVWQHGWAQTQTDVAAMAIYWLVFTGIDVLCGWVAYRLNARKQRYPALLLVAQRFVYRQLMYWVVLRAIGSAIGGLWVGWGKLERTGSVGSGERQSTA